MDDDVLTINEAWILYYKLSGMHRDMLAFRQTKGITSIHSKIQNCLQAIREYNNEIYHINEDYMLGSRKGELLAKHYSNITKDWSKDRHKRYISNTGSETKRDKDLHRYILAEYEVIKLLEN